MAGRPRPIPIILSRDEYRRLDELARSQDRDPVQQARWMLRQALDTNSHSERSEAEREAAEHASR